MKLHLGCGTRYLEGYVNIDHPPEEHTVQDSLKADRYADILELDYETGVVQEVRLHHVFEHFPRQTALALLCRWNNWLEPGGRLWIETPDVMRCSLAMVSPLTSEIARQQILRHVFGSHEASWAVHWDGWYKQKFAFTLKALGFTDLEFVQSRWGALRNIEVKATRGSRNFGVEDYRPIVRGLLEKSLVTYQTKESAAVVSESENKMLEFWMQDWEACYLNGKSGTQ